LHYRQIEEFKTAMTPGQLVSAVSIAMNVPHETVIVHDRNLSVAGLRTKGARGRNAPAVAPIDAARLVIAILGSARVVDSVNTLRAFEQVRFMETVFTANQTLAGEKKDYEREKASILAVMGPAQKINFTDDLAALISGASNPTLAENPESLLRQFAPWKIQCAMPGASFIGPLRYERAKSAREQQEFFASWKELSKGEEFYRNYFRLYDGVRQTRTVHSTAILLLGRAFRENGLPFKTTSDAVADLLQADAGKTTKKSSPKDDG
jgi:hypothetical protein